MPKFSAPPQHGSSFIPAARPRFSRKSFRTDSRSGIGVPFHITDVTLPIPADFPVSIRHAFSRKVIAASIVAIRVCGE